ncbi:hypothetical protein WUBG_10800 [Wuchereria bancrofti]|uniref:Uncharacterized protein n=1 Tax=Wuchereria bancrofti TaxID=6293 RepID=J9E821_WUCBA|nr:hypothetical protein WUBG_10800 [Wuchereria bancrofti]VDM22890.1 unnamed protein product [Wuchereria bancrofti]
MLRQALIIIDSLAGIFQLLPIVESLRFRQLRILIQLIFILLLLFYAKTIFAIGICTQPEMACGAQLRSYPLLTLEETSKMDFESNMKDFPLYDEFFTPIHVFDFSKTANITGERICECSNDTKCYLEEENIIKLDEMITLIFCDRVDNIFRRSCHGTRSLIRVIGRIHESGEALTTVVKTFLFCKCERGYRRIRVEAWLNHLYAFIYRCL